MILRTRVTAPTVHTTRAFCYFLNNDLISEGSFPTPYLLSPNLANAQSSTGPKSEEGKKRSSLNALKTGLTGRTILMLGDDAQSYQDHVCRFIDEFEPATAREEELVQSMADTRWRLLRIPALEANIYAFGALEFAEKFSAEADPGQVFFHSGTTIFPDLSDVLKLEERG